MSPSYRRKAKSTRRSTSRRGGAAAAAAAAAAALSSKQLSSSGENLESLAAVSPAKPSNLDLDLDCSSICSTPKAERFRIPEITTCPPAPRKRRLLTAAAACSLRRRPRVFFSPPDIELFFYLALRGIPL